MHDLIDRQAVIDAIVAWTVEDRPDIEMPTDLVGRINALPSAQHEKRTNERTETHARDCISRQAAIDALDYCDFTKTYNDDTALYKDSVIYELQQLPSARRWIPCREKDAEPNCLACDEFGQVFIASSIVTINGVCYDGTGFNFDVKDFLKGEKVQTISGYIYVLPRKITAWMPLPEPYAERRTDEAD